VTAFLPHLAPYIGGESPQIAIYYVVMNKCNIHSKFGKARTEIEEAVKILVTPFVNIFFNGGVVRMIYCPYVLVTKCSKCKIYKI
jgi:hypothetical protein